MQLPAPDAPLAAIDIGSNSFRLEIGQLQRGRYRRISYVKQTVRLGAGLDAAGQLSDEAAQRGLQCLQQFSEHLAGFEPAQVRAVATQTLREARNRDAFLRRAQAALGFPIEVVSGREEARLIYAGVSFLQPGNQPRLVIDIGGRSTEMILGLGRRPRLTESFAVGSVSLSMRWFADGRFTEQAFRDAQVAAGAELEEALVPFAPQHWREALGSSGTSGAVSQVLAGAGITDGSITPVGLHWCIEQCLKAGSADKLRLPTLRNDRRPIIGGGLALLYTLLTQFGIQRLLPAKGALRQGVVIDLHQRHAAQRQADAEQGADRGAEAGAGKTDLRDHSVMALQKRFSADLAQAARVRAVALGLFGMAWPADDVGPEHADDVEPLRELAWACDVHELGQMVSHHDHHRHSAYLLAHVDAPGFSQSQQRRMADLLLGQRGGLRKIEAPLRSALFCWQVLALRLAVIVCHARTPVESSALSLARDSADDRRASLAWPTRWGRDNPRTLHLLREESEAWARNGALHLDLP